MPPPRLPADPRPRETAVAVNELARRTQVFAEEADPPAAPLDLGILPGAVWFRYTPDEEGTGIAAGGRTRVWVLRDSGAWLQMGSLSPR